MGLFDLLRNDKPAVKVTRSALDEARDPGSDRGAIDKLVANILDTGIDGKGPLPGSIKVADKARAKSDDTAEAIGKVVGEHLRGGAAGGFVTSLGGFITMPVAIPVNVLEFYIQATRMVGAIAHLRGYDVNDPQVRTAVLLTLVGSDSEDVLRKAGVTVPGSAMTNFALQKLPKSALMMVNKAVGFRLLKSLGEKTFSKLGRGVPLVGGLVGAGLDGFMMKRIANAAKREFPQIG